MSEFIWSHSSTCIFYGYFLVLDNYLYLSSLIGIGDSIFDEISKNLLKIEGVCFECKIFFYSASKFDIFSFRWDGKMILNICRQECSDFHFFSVCLRGLSRKKQEFIDKSIHIFDGFVHIFYLRQA